MDYVRGCKQIMHVVANGLWLVFLGKMRPSDAILAYVCGLQMAYVCGLQMAYVCGCNWLMFFAFCYIFYA